MENLTILEGIVLTPLLKARQALEIALVADKTDLNRDASILRFRITFDLAMKTLNQILKYKGTFLFDTRDVFRESAKEGYIGDPVQWFTFLDNRNLTTHVYDEDIAEQIYGSLPSFNAELTKLIEKIIS